ncbi:MAG: hypothetical protein GEU78_14295 [Actinobacteria bacterium]|nr:hypothetical protein [Actinomycetota bacterium]
MSSTQDDPRAEVAKKVSARPLRGTTRVWWLGGASLAIRTIDSCIWVDPFFGPPARPQFHRQHPPLIRAHQAEPVTAVLITHEHNDHCHLPTLATLAEVHSFAIYAPAVSAAKIGAHMRDADIHVVDHGRAERIANIGLHVLSGNDPLAEEGVMYLVETQECHILLPGDSLYTPGFFGFLASYGLDLAFFSVGGLLFGKKAYMSPEEFGRAAQESGTRIAVPVHWDLWKEARLDPAGVKDWCTPSVRLLQPGDCIELADP